MVDKLAGVVYHGDRICAYCTIRRQVSQALADKADREILGFLSGQKPPEPAGKVENS
jgi:hypothetical protein